MKRREILRHLGRNLRVATKHARSSVGLSGLVQGCFELVVGKLRGRSSMRQLG